MAVRRKPAPKSADLIKKKDETEVRKEETINTSKEINPEKSVHKEEKAMQEHEKIDNDKLEVENEDEEINEIQIKEEVVKSTGKPSKTRFLSSTRVDLEESEHNEEEVMRDSENLEKKNLEDKIEEEQETEETKQEHKKYDLGNFQPALSKVTNRSELKAGVISIVNSNCGKRITLSKKLMDELSNPSKVAISFSDEVIAIGEKLINNNNQLIIKVSGTKGIIYSAGIVSEITERYDLDFSNRTSITFSEVEYIEVDGNTVAMISVDKDN